MRAIITGISHYVPKDKLTNKYFEQRLETSDEWIVSRTGIKERHILDKEKGVSFMAVKAAENLLEQRGITADELDLLIIATTTPDMMFPSTASIVQDEINAVNCWGYDMVAGCSGFLSALATASQFIETGRHKKVMVIGTDKMSSILDYQDRNTCILFGDAAGAVLLEPTDDNELGIKDYSIHLDGSGGKYLNMPAGGSLLPATVETVDKRLHFLRQDGKTVFKFAVMRMADISKKVLEKNGLSNEDLKFYIPHQANARIIDSVGKKIGLTEDQVVKNIEKYGNTTAATIPLAMSEVFHEGRLNKGDWVMLSAFGTGFMWGSLLLKWAI